MNSLYVFLTGSLGMGSGYEVEGHPDVVHVLAVEEELPAKHTFDDEPGRVVEPPGADVRREDTQGEAAGAAPAGLACRGVGQRTPAAPAPPGRGDSDPLHRHHMGARRKPARPAPAHVAGDLPRFGPPQ